MTWRARLRGALLAETAASIAILLPVVLLTALVIFQCANGFIIRQMVSTAAVRAARSLAIEYWKEPSIEFNQAAQQFYVFDRIRIPGVIASSEQFTAHFDHAEHGSVSVTATFQGQRFGLPQFPNPDMLGLGNFHISETATQWLY